MQLSESFYVALCGTILLLGVIYWFWTQIQYIQRKVNLLDNVVYEMKTLVSNLPGPSLQTEQIPLPELQEVEAEVELPKQDSPKPYAPPPESVAGDLEEERDISEKEFMSFIGSEENNKQEDDLAPGGLANPSENFTKDVTYVDKSLESPLQTMTTKELRRMAEANNIPGASTKSKKELVKILRDKVGAIIQNSENTSKIMSFDEISAPLTE